MRTWGSTVQVIPHVTDEIKRFIYEVGERTDADVVITEIGGTVGDIESQPFIEAIRQVSLENAPEDSLFVHVTPRSLPAGVGRAEVQADPAFGEGAAGARRGPRHHRAALRSPPRGRRVLQNRTVLQRQAGLRHREPYPREPLRGAAHARARRSGARCAAGCGSMSPSPT